MSDLIQMSADPVKRVLSTLLKDRTTGKNIIFATDAYATDSQAIEATTHMTVRLLQSLGTREIQPRVLKSQAEQTARTRNKAEVFTPAWICNKMNNHCDTEWFGQENVFNTEDGQEWTVTEGKITFPEGKDWKEYTESKRLEITCGEAPYIVSRYDAATGVEIPLERRIGILDRKIRVINEHTKTEKTWLTWVYKAYQSVYGYEFQGDNLLIARINLLVSFVDYMQDRWGRKPTDAELKKIADIITWNIWQMDGITGTLPFGKPEAEYRQMSFFDFATDNSTETDETAAVDCRIMDWQAGESITYNSIKRG